MLQFTLTVVLAPDAVVNAVPHGDTLAHVERQRGLGISEQHFRCVDHAQAFGVGYFKWEWHWPFPLFTPWCDFGLMFHTLV